MAERIRGGRAEAPPPEPKSFVSTTDAETTVATIDAVLADYEREKSHAEG